MGQMEINLRGRLINLGYNLVSKSLAVPNFERIKSSIYYNEIFTVYKKLGGILSEIPINLKKWDIETNDAAIELDEYLHFNRYRQITLESPLYKLLPKFPLADYENYCKFNESGCIKAGSYGGKWTNSSCEKQFGVGSVQGKFDTTGSPRWKQRAFYDFIKDLSYLLLGFSLIRISIYDLVTINGTQKQVRELLESDSSYGSKELGNLIENRRNT